MTTTRTRTAAIATTVLLSLGGGAYATAASTTGTTGAAGAPGDRDETALTGETAAKVRAAALKAVPGATVLRVETDAGGVYEAHLRKADGTHVKVTLGKDFTVTEMKTERERPRRPRPPARPVGGGRAGDDARRHPAKLRAALVAVRPAKGDRGADKAAAIAKALGESTVDVQKVLDSQPARRGTRPARGTRADQSALTAALAKAFGTSQAKVEAALETAKPAARDARLNTMAAALAKELGLDTAKVKAAPSRRSAPSGPRGPRERPGEEPRPPAP